MNSLEIKSSRHLHNFIYTAAITYRRRFDDVDDGGVDRDESKPRTFFLFKFHNVILNKSVNAQTILSPTPIIRNVQ